MADGSQLNFESQNVYTLTVQVLDDDGNADPATITVDLNDLDEAPAIASASFIVPVNAANGTPVGNVPVAEPDANDTYAYSITAGDPAGAFAIDNAGNLSVADRSQLMLASGGVYTLTVQVADDDGNADTATISVDVLFGTLPSSPEPDDGPGADPDPGDDPQPDPESDIESEPAPEDGPQADVPLYQGFVESSIAPSILSTPHTDSLEVDLGTGGDSFVYQELNDDLEQDGGDLKQIPLASGERALLGAERMARALDQIRTEMTDVADEAAREQEIIVSSAEGAMIAASLAWLALLPRGGSLAALAFSSLPLWRGVDPLAVLALSDEERKRIEEDNRKAREQEDEKEKAVGRLFDDR